jgi:DNA-binding MarR family transcriptional regulator
MGLQPLDNVNLLLYVRDRYSIPEMAQKMVCSVSTIHEALRFLEQQGLVNPPPRPNMARSRTLTTKGTNELNRQLEQRSKRPVA